MAREVIFFFHQTLQGNCFSSKHLINHQYLLKNTVFIFFRLGIGYLPSYIDTTKNQFKRTRENVRSTDFLFNFHLHRIIAEADYDRYHVNFN